MDKTGKIIRIAAIIMLGLTAAMNLLGGIGTTCAAFSNNVGYRMAFKELMDVRWLYQILVVTTILIGLAGIWALVKMVRGGPTVYRNAVIILVIGSILGGIQYFTSLSLRGEAAPANVKFFLNLLTLVLFLVLRIPSIWKKIDFQTQGGRTETKAGLGFAAIVTGTLTLTVFIWAGPSHTVSQENLTYVLLYPLVFVGVGMIVWGVRSLVQVISDIYAQEEPAAQLRPSES